MIKDAKVLDGQEGYINNILKLKKVSIYNYIQNNRFPKQRRISNIIYLFKMATLEIESSVDLVRRMHPQKNLQFA